MTSSYSGNPRWFAPELLRESGDTVSTHSDVWSFGMLCLEILSGDVPFAGIRRDLAVPREIDNGVLPKHPGLVAVSQGLSDAIWKLLQKCWEREPAKRPSITEVKNSLLGRVVPGKLEISCNRSKLTDVRD
jgi:son of sevenless-like protein